MHSSQTFVAYLPTPYKHSVNLKLRETKREKRLFMVIRLKFADMRYIRAFPVSSAGNIACGRFAFFFCSVLNTDTGKKIRKTANAIIYSSPSLFLNQIRAACPCKTSKMLATYTFSSPILNLAKSSPKKKGNKNIKTPFTSYPFN